MKIRELLEKKLVIPKSKKPISGIIQSRGLSHLGTGWQAIAYKLKSRPNTVVKTMAVHGENDPVFQFLRVASNHQDNPYFPKVYFMKMYPMDDSSKAEREYEMDLVYPNELPPGRRDNVIVSSMEKLNEFSTLGEQGGLAVLNAIGIHPKQPERKFNYPVSTVNYISTLFEKPESRKQIFNLTTDPQLKQALRLMEPLFRKFHPDVHGGNIMYRNGPNGPHLVFVDPVSDAYSGTE
jgi:hypothetical protein